MRSTKCIAVLALAASVCACAASNPTRTNEPAPWEPKPKSEAAAANPGATTTKAPDANAKDPAPTAQAGDAAKTPAAANAAASNGNASNDTAPKSTTDAGAQPDKSDPKAGAQAAGAAAADKTAHDPADKSTRPAEPVVARVAGDPIYVSELFEQALYSEPLEMFDHIESAVMGRLVMAEAKRLRVHLDASLDSSGYEEAVKVAESRYAKQFPNMPLDRFVDRVLGLDPIKYRDHLRENSRKTLIASRVARAWLLQQEHADIHVIVVGSEDDMKAVQKDLADGVTFEDVARKRSVDPSKEQGGQVVPMVKKDTPLGKLAFETPAGKVGGPLTDHGAWLLVRVDAVHSALEGDWTRLGPAVEQSLKDRDVDSLEIRQWRAAMLDRYAVEISPFLNMVGDSDR